MKTLLVQDYLRSGKTLEDLKTEHGIKYSIKNHKVSLNYHQLNSKETDPLACQCRGTVLVLDTWDLLACPMERFFNYGQFTTKVDLTEFDILEKLDGTCCIVYYDYVINKWCLGTRNTPEGDGEINSGFKVIEIFENSLKHLTKDQSYDLQAFMKNAPVENTYIFELCTIHNRIVCEYKEPRIVLLAVKNNLEIEEKNPVEYIKLLQIAELPAVYSFNNIVELSNVINSFDPIEHEGVVLVRRDDYFRLKLKNEAYSAFNKLHDMLDTCGMRNTVRLILSGKDDDVYSMIDPYNQKKLTWLKGLIRELVLDIDKEYLKYSDIVDQKEYALAVKGHKYQSVLFALRKGQLMPDALYKKDTLGNFTDSTVDGILSMIRKNVPNLDELNKNQMYS